MLLRDSLSIYFAIFSAFRSDVSDECVCRRKNKIKQCLCCEENRVDINAFPPK